MKENDSFYHPQNSPWQQSFWFLSSDYIRTLENWASKEIWDGTQNEVDWVQKDSKWRFPFVQARASIFQASIHAFGIGGVLGGNKSATLFIWCPLDPSLEDPPNYTYVLMDGDVFGFSWIDLIRPLQTKSKLRNIWTYPRRKKTQVQSQSSEKPHFFLKVTSSVSTLHVGFQFIGASSISRTFHKSTGSGAVRSWRCPSKSNNDICSQCSHKRGHHAWQILKYHSMSRDDCFP